LATAHAMTVWELIHPLVRTANFFKHADQDADATLDFDEGDAEVALQLACHDFGRIAGGMPIEAQIHEAFITTIAFAKVSEPPLRSQRLIRAVIQQFPGVRVRRTVRSQRETGSPC
jgi:hypothetical protein